MRWRASRQGWSYGLTRSPEATPSAVARTTRYAAEYESALALLRDHTLPCGNCIRSAGVAACQGPARDALDGKGLAHEPAHRLPAAATGPRTMAEPERCLGVQGAQTGRGR